ncbi:hypothetical protein IJ162_02265 [Candidatus Saccharibacteria bacterium]|nr:hypothetical protein [Candidatus Saccharibacteria bacterium]
MTWSCERCGKPFLTEEERDRHQAKCGLTYEPSKCLHCGGTGKTVDHMKCPYCGGSGYKV